MRIRRGGSGGPGSLVAYVGLMMFSEGIDWRIWRRRWGRGDVRKVSSLYWKTFMFKLVQVWERVWEVSNGSTRLILGLYRMVRDVQDRGPTGNLSREWSCGRVRGVCGPGGWEWILDGGEREQKGFVSIPRMEGSKTLDEFTVTHRCSGRAGTLYFVVWGEGCK